MRPRHFGTRKRTTFRRPHGAASASYRSWKVGSMGVSLIIFGGKTSKRPKHYDRERGIRSECDPCPPSGRLDKGKCRKHATDAGEQGGRRDYEKLGAGARGEDGARVASHGLHEQVTIRKAKDENRPRGDGTDQAGDNEEAS